ncbi:G-type lectin S-receptor serine/threonine-protein [Salix suchowensis]|nr:G-type lectin S-receptor serine/threonine-protein [Salix suchowensis]
MGIPNGETLLSDGGSFELGFFNPGNSTNRYLGLWHTKSPKTVLWVANRDTPFSDRLGVLTITREGLLVLYNSTNQTAWSSNPSRTAENPVAELLDYGNLVVREENDSNPENMLWQSFDHPCDTLMLGMKLGSNFVTKTDQGNKTLFRGGSWNGINFSYIWSDRTNDWVITDAGQPDQCDNYAICGPNTRCEINRSPICVCLDGFVPKSLADLNFSDWSGGCIRRTPLECSDKVGFLKYTGMKLPDTSSSWYDKSISIKECKGLCSKNCSCTAYANLDIRDGGSGCLIWFGELIDIRKSTGDGQDLYVRMNATELDVGK